MRTIVLLFAFFVFLSAANKSVAKDVWSLERCINYALEHNISIQQNVLNERLASLRLDQIRYSQLPNANVSTAYGRSFGRSIDPTSNQFNNTDYNFVNISGNADVLLFGWFLKRNQIAQNKFSSLAAKQDLSQLQNDVSLNVATGFLRALQAKEQIRISEKQVDLSKAQLQQTRRFAEAGRLPELNVAQLESQLATDSANLINVIANYTASVLDLKALLNLDFALPFEIEPPVVNVADVLNLNELDPEQVYSAAYGRFGSIKASEYKLLAAKKGLGAARSAQWPQLGLNLQTGSNYANSYKEVSGYVLGSPQPTGSYVDVTGNQYLVYQPTAIPVLTNVDFGKQLSNNFRQTISLSLTVPIFNAWQARFNVGQAKINVRARDLDKEQAELTLRQDVYKAFNDARNSIQKYNAANRAAVAANRAYEFAQKRYDLGLTNTIEYLVTQNTQYSADANLLSAKYDLIFRLKVIDYYLGKELKL